MLSDFKTNEYATLVEGADYEPKEENPMLGFRGAARYYDPRYQHTFDQDTFALECLAIKKVREEMGLQNLKIMVPLFHTVEEGRKRLAEMSRHGMARRGEMPVGEFAQFLTARCQRRCGNPPSQPILVILAPPLHSMKSNVA